MEMGYDHVRLFLDVMEYLNRNAKRLGGKNIKDLFYRLRDYGFLPDSSFLTNKFIYFCNIRNNIAHGDASFVEEITRGDIFLVYSTGLFILMQYSEEWECDGVDGDIYCYHNDELTIRFSKLMRDMVTNNRIFYIEFKC